MDLRHLNYFLVLAEELHFGRAAERLNISQPPLSRMIAQIEQDLGVVLFERTKRRVVLTSAGVELLQSARQMILQMDTVRKRLSDHSKGESGTLRVGYVGAVMHSRLPQILSAFASTYKNISLQFEEQPNTLLLHGLNNSTLDVAFVRTWLHPDTIHEELVLSEPFVAVVPEKHRLAKKKVVSMKELRDEKFIIFARDCGPTIFDNFLSMCSKAGFAPNILHQASQLNSVLRLVENGLGISLLPAHVQIGYKLKLKFIPIENAKENIPLIMLTREENPNPAMGHLAAFVRGMMNDE